MVETLRPQCDRALSWIPIDQLRAGVDTLAARIGRLAGTVIVADAETDADLDTLVEAALTVRAVAPCSRARRAWPARSPRGWACCRSAPSCPPDGAGSSWPAACNRPRAGRSRKRARPASPCWRRPSGAWPIPRDGLARLAAQAAAAIEKERWDLVAVTGGETAVALWAALGADRLDLVGVPAPGLALGHLRVRGREPLALLTKAGGFGPPDLFVSLQKEAVA